MRKRVLALLISIVLISLAGCSSDNTEVTSDIDNNDVSNIMSDEPIKQNEPQSIDDILGETSGENTEEVDIQNDKVYNNNNENKISSETLLSGICEFRVIDCGQADSILIQSGDNVILVDAGESTGANDIINVLDNEGIKQIDLLVATHPHADHIGGMQTIVENYDIVDILMSPTGHTSKTYEKLLTAIDAKGYSIYQANVGDEYSYGSIELKVLGPYEDYGDLNNNSVVMLASFGEIDVLLTGDAEMKAEKDFVSSIGDIEILKVGHHGSDTSTSDNLLDVTTPEVALISCGVGNSYGHPCAETLDKLSERNIYTYRTDISGDLIVRTDGKEYTIETEVDGEVTTGDAQNNNNKNTDNKNKTTNNNKTETIVYVSKSGKKYHSTEQCSRLYTSKVINELTEKEAINKGIAKCSNCWED